MARQKRSRDTRKGIRRARRDLNWNSSACCPVLLTACGNTCPGSPCVVQEGELYGRSVGGVSECVGLSYGADECLDISAL